MREIWKDIEGYEGKYQISNYGNVKSNTRWGKGKILKGGKTKGNPQPYRFVVLVKTGRKDAKNFYIHRLVAKYFCDNPNGYNEVNHIDGNTFNNRFDNLEWCTHKQNMENANKRGALVDGHSSERGAKHPNAKAVLQYTMDGVFVKEWGSVNQIMRETGIPANAIFRVCSDKYPHEHSAKGYRWRYK